MQSYIYRPRNSRRPVPGIPAGDQQQGCQGYPENLARLELAFAERQTTGRSGLDVQSDHPGVDQLLWLLLQVRPVPDPEMSGSSPCHVGDAEIQTLTESPETRSTVAELYCTKTANFVCSLEIAVCIGWTIGAG